MGNPHYPKEFCQIYFDGKIIILDDYKKLIGYGIAVKNIHSKESDKGQYEALLEFAEHIKREVKSPIPLWQLIQATEVSFQDKSLLLR
jgi:hypothetical protein